MKIEAKEPAGRRRDGMAVSVSTSAGSSSCLLGGRFERGWRESGRDAARRRAKLRLC
jgi:hypothetical protein